jgi:hypothetical protein
MTLQEQFLQHGGSPIEIDQCAIVQMDRLPIHDATVTLRFLRGQSGNGVALKSANGFITLSDDRSSSLIHIWNEPNLPSEVTHFVRCPDGELRVWNIYHVQHPGGQVTEDAWTGNAGMIVENIAERKRHYRCSAGPGNFDPNFEFEIEWT